MTPFNVDDPRYKNLSAAISELNNLEYRIKTAIDLPAQRAGEVRSLSIHGSHYRDPEPHVIELAKAVQATATEEARQRGEIERDKMLREYSARIEALRAVLPGYAAEASIYLGIVARGLLS